MTARTHAGSMELLSQALAQALAPTNAGDQEPYAQAHKLLGIFNNSKHSKTI